MNYLAPINRRRFMAAAAASSVAAWAAPSYALEDKNRYPKGGFCCTTKREDWLDRVLKLSPNWMYTWGSVRPSDLPKQIDFAPMMWGDAREPVMSKKLESIREGVQAGNFDCLMGFNEPDQSSQSNMTVDRVVELWPRLMEIETPLVSPGCVHPDREWMRQFMDRVDQEDLRVDFVAVHTYGGPSVEHLVKRLESVHQMYGRPLWITEMAVGDWNAKTVEQNRHSAASIEAFMRELLPALEEMPCVARYAWFSAAPTNAHLGTATLFDSVGRLTPLGRIYAERENS